MVCDEGSDCYLYNADRTVTLRNAGFGDWHLVVTPESAPETVPEPTALLGLAALGAMAAGGRLKKKGTA